MSKEKETKNGFRELSCVLTDAEKITAGEKLVDLLREITAKELEVKRIAKRYAVEISDLQVKADYQADLVETGTEMRETAIQTIKDYKAGDVTVVRMDTKQEIEKRKMTPEESQKEIPLGDPVKPKEKKAKNVPKDAPKEPEKAPEGVQTAPPADPVTPPAPITVETMETAMEHIRATHRASTSSIQRRMRVSFNEACRIMDALEANGYVGPATEEGSVREILKKEPF